MNQTKSTSTAYRLAVVAEDNQTEIATIMSDSPVPVPDSGEKINLVEVTGESSELEREATKGEDISERDYLVESREYEYMSFENEGPGEGDALGCSVTLFVSDVN